MPVSLVSLCVCDSVSPWLWQTQCLCLCVAQPRPHLRSPDGCTPVSQKNRTLLNTQLQDRLPAVDAVNAMAEQHVSCVLITDSHSRLDGLFTARDFLTRIVVKGRDAVRTHVTDVKTANVRCAAPTITVSACVALMLHDNIRHMPVVDEATGVCVGLVTLADLLQVFYRKPETQPSSWRLQDVFSLLPAR